MTWRIEQTAGGSYRLHHVESDTYSYRDRHGRPYTKRSIRDEVDRYTNAGQPKPAKRQKCPQCGGTLNRPSAMLPCRCDRTKAAE